MMGTPVPLAVLGTGYHNIVKAVLDAAGRMKVAQAAE